MSIYKLVLSDQATLQLTASLSDLVQRDLDLIGCPKNFSTGAEPGLSGPANKGQAELKDARRSARQQQQSLKPYFTVLMNSFETTAELQPESLLLHSQYPKEV